MKPIRILQENVIMNPGGIESLLMNLYRHIDREVVQFDFMLHRPQRGAFDDEIERMGGKIYRTEAFDPFRYGAYISSMKKVFAEHPEYRIVHAHSELNYWPLKLAKELGVPIRIAHSHNARCALNLKYFFLCYEKLFIKSVATELFMCSKLAGEWSYGKRAIAGGKCVFLKNGIEVEKYTYSERKRAEIRRFMGVTDKLVIGHVGRFMQQKNHTFLIDIFKALHNKCPESVLLLISEGRLLDEIKRKVHRLGLENSVYFLGFRNNVHELMQAMDVFVLPSLWEGLPFTLIESQSAGLPSVISDVISDEAVITNLITKVSLKRPAEEWAEAILKSYKNTRRRNTSEQVRAAGFDIIHTAKWIQNYYIQKYRGAEDAL